MSLPISVSKIRRTGSAAGSKGTQLRMATRRRRGIDMSVAPGHGPAEWPKVSGFRITPGTNLMKY